MQRSLRCYTLVVQPIDPYRISFVGLHWCSDVRYELNVKSCTSIPGGCRSTLPTEPLHAVANKQEEMTIRAMTCHGRRRKHNHDRHNSSSGGEDSRTGFSHHGGQRLTPTTASSSSNRRHRSHSGGSRAQTAVARGSGQRGGIDSDEHHGPGDEVGVSHAASRGPVSLSPTAPPRRRANEENGYPGGGGNASLTPLAGTDFASQNATTATSVTDVSPSDTRKALTGTLTGRSGSWGAGIANGHRGSSGGSIGLESRGGER